MAEVHQGFEPLKCLGLGAEHEAALLRLCGELALVEKIDKDAATVSLVTMEDLENFAKENA